MTACATALVAALVLSANHIAPSLTELEEAVLAYRRGIIRGHVVVRSKHLKQSPNPAANERSTAVWFDSQRLRNDLSIRYAVDAPMHLDIFCRAGLGPDSAKDYAVFYSEQEQPKETVLAIHMDKVDERWNIPMLHPNMIGLAIDDTPNLAQHSLESLVQRADRRDAHLARDTESPGSIWQVTYIGSAGEQVGVWIDADKGPSVTRARVEWPRDKVRTVDSIDITLGTTPFTGPPRPSRSEFLHLD